MCPITQVDSTFHEKFWNTIFVHWINFDFIKSFWNVITTLFVSGELVSRCFTETKSQTPKQAVHVRDWCGSTWVGVFGSGRYRPTLFFQLHHWYLDTAAPQRGRAKCLKMSVHTCVSSLAGSLSTRLEILSGLVVFWGLMFSSRPQWTPWEAADLLCLLQFPGVSICPALPWALT